MKVVEILNNAVNAREQYQNACQAITDAFKRKRGFENIFDNFEFEYIPGDEFCITWDSDKYEAIVTPIVNTEMLEYFLKIRSPKKLADELWEHRV